MLMQLNLYLHFLVQIMRREGNNMKKMKNCNTCGSQIAANAKMCPSCGAKNKQPIFKRFWFWLLIVFVVVPTVTAITVSEVDQDPAESTNQTITPSVNPDFEGDCGITASAKMGESIIGLPQLSISITNTSDKEISAIQFYAVPYDVYGEEITGWTSQNKLYTDTAIAAGESTSIEYQFIEDSVKTVKLYVYSIYFSDGSEWGDKEAWESVILDNGAIIEVSDES